MNMQYNIQYHATELERKLAEDREENFRGTACVSLRRLNFKPEHSRDIDRKNIERLKRIFARQGCLRLSPSNHVPAIITEQDLKVALQHSGKTLKDLLNSAQDAPLKLTLPPNYMLECLHGQHRILAALEILIPKEEWWTVDLYLSGSTLKPSIVVLECLTLSPSSNESGGQSRLERGVLQLVQFCRRRNLWKDPRLPTAKQALRCEAVAGVLVQRQAERSGPASNKGKVQGGFRYLASCSWSLGRARILTW
jgi:hypothetical protein